MSKRAGAAIGLLLIDLGIFAATCVYLPRRGSWGHSGPWSNFINSRDRWDIAWGVLVAAVIISVGVFLLLQAFGAFGGKTENLEQGAARESEKAGGHSG